MAEKWTVEPGDAIMVKRSLDPEAPWYGAVVTKRCGDFIEAVVGSTVSRFYHRTFEGFLHNADKYFRNGDGMWDFTKRTLRNEMLHLEVEALKKTVLDLSKQLAELGGKEVSAKKFEDIVSKVYDEGAKDSAAMRSRQQEENRQKAVAMLEGFVLEDPEVDLHSKRKEVIEATGLHASTVDALIRRTDVLEVKRRHLGLVE